MRLSADAHAEIEWFMRRHLGRPGLRLPPIHFHAGPASLLLIRAIGMSAITFGRHVFVNPVLVRRDEEGRAALAGRLLVHEVTHVLQYEEKGFLRFLAIYLRGYWRALRSGGRWDRAGREAAYLAIAEECEARAAADAYQEYRRG